MFSRVKKPREHFLNSIYTINFENIIIIMLKKNTVYCIQNVLLLLFWKQFTYKICNKYTFSNSAVNNVY